MNKERLKQKHRKLLKAKTKARKKSLKQAKLLLKRKIRRDPNKNLKSQIKELQSPTFNRNAYMPKTKSTSSKDVLKTDKFNVGKWLPPEE